MGTWMSRRVWKGLAAFGAAGVLCAPGQASAHDYWLVPDPLLAPSPPEVVLSLYVGDGFVVELEKEMEPARTARFVRHFRGGVEDLSPRAQAGARPFARVAAPAPGGHLFVLDRTPARIQLEAAKFEAYLHAEGLDAIVAERARLGESGKPGRERYERSLKALVQIGPPGDAVFATQVGQSLEIVPVRDPTRPDAGPLRVTVRFRSAPLRGALVERVSRPAGPGPAGSYSGTIEKATARTGPDGTATFDAPKQGVHILRLVHMVRCEGCADADWHSFWSSFTFATGPSEPGDIVRPPVLTAPAGRGDGAPAEKWPVLAGLVLSALAAAGWALLGRTRGA